MRGKKGDSLPACLSEPAKVSLRPERTAPAGRLRQMISRKFLSPILGYFAWGSLWYQ